jgi:hypothetical protein
MVSFIWVIHFIWVAEGPIPRGLLPSRLGTTSPFGAYFRSVLMQTFAKQWLAPGGFWRTWVVQEAGAGAVSAV